MPLIECVPNVSEGRRLDVVQAIADAMRAVDDVRLLDRSSDRSHHRSVLTIVGEPEALRCAVLALVERAVASIDLRTHDGVHPRIGAVDVVPFVPLRDTSMADCVALARRVGAEIADRFAVPVFLYGEAATRPERRALEAIRRGRLEGLAARMSSPGGRPDFGPHTLHPSAGATAVGARPVLIAYNIVLHTDRIDVARRIATAVRERDGGLPAVQALGLRLADRELVQVSMNLTDHTRTSLGTVFDRVREEAAREGVTVVESELVGMVPEAALAGASPADRRLAELPPDRVIERRLGAR